MGKQKWYAIGSWSKQNQRLWEGRNEIRSDDGLSKTMGYGNAETAGNWRMAQAKQEVMGGQKRDA